MFIHRYRHLFVPTDGADGAGGGGGDDGETGSHGGSDAGGKGATGATGGNAPAQIVMSSEAFNERVHKAQEAAQRKLLRELGYDKVDDVKATLKTAKQMQAEKLSETERLQAQIKDLEPKAAKADQLGKRFAAQVEVEFAALDEKMREAIDEVADGDAEKRFDQMQVFRKAGLLGAKPSIGGGGNGNGNGKKAGAGAGDGGEGGEGKQKPKAPANVGSGGVPPKGAPPLDHFKHYEKLRAATPALASVYYQVNAQQIEEGRSAAE